MKTLTRLEKKDKNHAKIPEVRHYMIQIYRKLGDEQTAKSKEKELIALAPDSKWAKATLRNNFYFSILRPIPALIPVALLKSPPSCPPAISIITEPIFILSPVPQTKPLRPPSDIPK